MLMKKLARNWKKISVGDKFTLPTRDEDDSRPMDSREQEELILSLERTEAEQSVLWRRVVGGLEFCYAAFLLYSTFQQALFPWELRYHAYFMEDMDSSMVIIAGSFFFFFTYFCCSSADNIVQLILVYVYSTMITIVDLFPRTLNVLSWKGI
ncbi:hypothetical protein DKX38_009918 [Salix brachista]|uniref:Transmembrane protein n=1 Tax=Salix brachista TaxID=2182728 RepID=A0A5N5MC18_9ROSI|nr:hypothetical protein DKX38_009918 [Salix brachista]